jgi:hypothetical protein
VLPVKKRNSGKKNDPQGIEDATHEIRAEGYSDLGPFARRIANLFMVVL